MNRKTLLSILCCVLVIVPSSFGQFGSQDQGTFNNQPFNNQFVTGNGQTFAGTNQNPGLNTNTGVNPTFPNNQGGSLGQPDQGNSFGQGNNLGQPGNDFGQGNNIGQPGNNFGQQGNIGQPGNNFGQQGNIGQPGNNFGQQGNIGQPGNNFGQQGNIGQPGNNFGQQGNIGQPGNNFGQQGNIGQGNSIGGGGSFGQGINNLGGFQPLDLGGIPGGFSPIGGFNALGSTFGNPFVGEGFGGQFFGGIGQDFNGPQNNPNQMSLGNQLFMNLAQNPLNYRYGTCRFNSSNSPVYGRADFRQFLFGDSPVDVRIQVWGLPTSPVDTQRGIHIHEFGDVTDGCARVGPHFNPIETRHGGRNSLPFLRHVGDIGNMLQSPQGITSTQFRDNVISLIGGSSIVGRALVIKMERDDEGFGTNVASTHNGNARTPLACCTIGRSGPRNWNNPWSENELVAASSGFQNTMSSQGQGPSTGTVTPSPNFNFIGKK